MIRLLICDDSEEARRAVRTMLAGQPQIEIVGEAADGAQAVTLAVALWPDVVLMDVDMPVLGGVEATRRIRSLLPEVRVVAYSGSGERESIVSMIEAGASAYCVKGSPLWELERVVADPSDPLVRLAHRLASAVTAGGTAELVARELADLSCASFAATYLCAHEGLSLAGIAGPGAVDGLASAPEVAYRAIDEGGWLRATPAELAELYRLGIPCAEALAAPLVAHGETLGALVVGMPMNVQFRGDPEFLTSVAELAAASVAVERTLAVTFAEARSDALTGLANRRAFDEHLDALIPEALASGQEVSLVLFDLDDFKEINDREGHLSGDRVLRTVAKMLVRAIRADEEVFRVGGDEFAAVVRGGPQAAARVAQRARAMLVGQRRGDVLPTVSAGIATLPGDATEKEELVRNADRALYRAKRTKNAITQFASGVRTRPGLLADPPQRARSGSDNGRGVRLLLVDDDPALRLVLRTTLEVLGVEVAQADSAGAAAAAIEASRPDLVVVDSVLPDVDGPALCRRLKADPATRTISVVLLTGSGSVDGDAARSAGADRFLRKPFSPLELVAVVDDLAGGIDATGERRPEEQLLAYAHDLRRLLEVEQGQRSLLEGAYRATVSALAGALEWKDLAGGGTSQRVQRYATALAKVLDPLLLDDPSVEYGFLLHDVGKLGIPDSILLKDGPLTASERELIETHTLVGERLLADVAVVQGEGLRVVRSHHERWDGSGYPDGLRGTEIPVAARVFAVADALDAMTSRRPYRAAATWQWAVTEIVAGSRRQFDPAVVEALRERERLLNAIHSQRGSSASE